MNVLVLGSGGREHALCKKISISPLLTSLFAIPGNPGMLDYASCYDINAFDEQTLKAFVKKHHIDLIIPGAEAYLVKGIANWFDGSKTRVFGPSKEATLIESSKTFAKELMHQYNIPTASYQSFTHYETALNHLKKIDAPYVIKYNGLAGGKGVTVTSDLSEAKKTLKTSLQDNQFGDESVIIESFLDGDEFSLMCFVHDDIILPMPICQDHKRLYENEQGPNTGGMGMVTPVASIKDTTLTTSMDTIMRPIVQGLKQNQTPFTGFLYGGLIQTKTGPFVIEFNARFGDPEAEVLCEALQSDLLEIILDLLDHKAPQISWSNNAYCGVTLANKGYPIRYDTGDVIHGLDQVKCPIYHMGTRLSNNELFTNGGRVLFVVGHGASLEAATQSVYNNIKHIQYASKVFRTDIGNKSKAR